jgi:hypothetical protein
MCNHDKSSLLLARSEPTIETKEVKKMKNLKGWPFEPITPQGGGSGDGNGGFPG